ncbi:MAG: hypothetical protein GF317_22400, partial [Candidatus Lokiarchaeota archaeon]|nr:hypothetical protein [Candidatus Lokiarchaeota archaeon]MBD3202212.1 hypothetical protein [Candidatus Lokiarchaeota archaeon]
MYKKKYIRLLLILTIVSIIEFVVIYEYNNKNNDIIDNNPKNVILKQRSKFNIDPFFIDDLDPNYNWEKFVYENPWVNGSGTKEDPYIIKNAKINCIRSILGISIFNSQKYVIIQDCELYTAKF